MYHTKYRVRLTSCWLTSRWWYDLSHAKDEMNWIEMILLVSYDKRHSVSYQTETDLLAVDYRAEDDIICIMQKMKWTDLKWDC